MIWLVGLRDIDLIIAGDTPTYIHTYNQLGSIFTAWEDGAYFYGNKEILFWPFAALIKSIGFSAQAWLISILLLPCVFISVSYRIIVNDHHYWVILFSALFLTYYIVFSLAVRQAIAEGFVVFSFVLAYKNKNCYSFLFSLIAFGFHQSALFALFIIPIYKISLNKNKMYLIFFIAASLSFVLRFYLVDMFYLIGVNSLTIKAQAYTSGNNFEFDYNLFNHKQFCLLFFVYFVYILSYVNKQTAIYNLVFFYLMCMILFFNIPVIGGRMMGYETILMPIMLWELFDKYLVKKSHVILYCCFFILMGFSIINSQSAIEALGLF